MPVSHKSMVLMLKIIEGDEVQDPSYESSGHEDLYEESRTVYEDLHEEGR